MTRQRTVWSRVACDHLGGCEKKDANCAEVCGQEKAGRILTTDFGTEDTETTEVSCFLITTDFTD